jgi:TonB-linked SusC/RagA family outer membrane protein
MKKATLLHYGFTITAFLLLSFTSFAQQRKISGVVQDGKNNPLEGATVSVKGIKKNTITKADGKFELTVPTGKVSLTVSFVGYQTKTLTVGANETSALVTLNESSNQLNDVVIVGVQAQSKRKTTSAISTVLSKDIENLPAPSVDQLLQGRVAGLNVQIGSGEPGVAPTIVVRGNTRVNTNINDNNVAQAHALSGPLYVIDGVPTNPEDISNSFDVTGTNYLAGININDIESVDVQKDAAATAAWGSRGANGVVYIKTKKGHSGKPEFRVNVYGGFIQQPDLLQTSTGAAERDQKMNIINQYATPGILANIPQILTDRYNPYYNNATDWQGLFYRTGSIKNVDATVSASNENVNYRVSANYYDEKGIIESFGFKRYSMRGNFDFKISPKLNSQLIVSFSKSERQRGMKYSGNSDDNTPVSGSSQPTSFYRLTSFDSANFTGIYDKLRNKNINDYYNASLTVNYKILPDLRYTFQGAANISATNRDYFRPSNVDEVKAQDPDAPAQPSFAESDKGTYSTYFISNTLNYIKKIETPNHVHNFAITGSQQFNADVSNTNYVQGYNVPSNNIRVVSGIPQADLSGGSDYLADGLLSFIGQAQYDFDNKYLIYGSYRGDASSRFGANTKWGYFPAGGIGWIVSEEKFMQKIKNVVSFLKLRASYGVSGSQSPDFYAPYNSYDIPGTYNGGIAIQPSYTNGLTKNNLTWTKTTQKDFGIDAQFFNSRITLAVDIYEKLSKDDYYDFELPFYTGFQSIKFNAHDLWVSNRGVDITLSTKNLSRQSPLQWNMQLTLSHNKNAIAKLPNNNRTFVIDDYYGVSRIFAVGQPIYEMFQLKYLGVYNNQSEIPFDPVTGEGLTYFKGNHKVVPGDPKWQDVNNIGDVWPDEDNGAAYGDRIATGDPNPKFTGGWVNEFTYKNFSLSVLSIFTWKRDIVNTYFQQQISNIVGGYSSNIYTFANSRLPDLSGLNYWVPQKAKDDPNYKADFPSINPFGPSYYQYIPISSQFNEDGSYFKVKSISLSYRLPESVIQRLKIKGISVYSTIDNVFTLKKGTMPNPELVDQLGIYTGGLYPTPTRITLGADIQF